MIFDSLTALVKTALDKWIPDATVREQVAAQLSTEMTKVLELEINDRVSARAREVSIRDHTPARLAFITIGGFLGLSSLLIFNLLWFHTVIPSEAMALIGTIIGYLSAKSELALAYYFGSSQGSERKTELLARHP